MKFQAVMAKIHLSHASYLKKLMGQIMATSPGNALSIDNLEKTYALIGRLSVRLGLLRKFKNVVSRAYGTALPVKIDEIDRLIEICNRQIDLAMQAADALRIQAEKKGAHRGRTLLRRNLSRHPWLRKKNP